MDPRSLISQKAMKNEQLISDKEAKALRILEQ